VLDPVDIQLYAPFDAGRLAAAGSGAEVALLDQPLRQERPWR
jgi:hypothetical protein